jgi:SET domain-containing protein
MFPLTEVFVTNGCGYGLRTKEAVPAKTILCEYVGEVITTDECKRRLVSYKKHEDFYFAALQGGVTLDAKACGSVARFANHSCDPSCELQKWTVLGT